jgi:hypothetical protein
MSVNTHTHKVVASISTSSAGIHTRTMGIAPLIKANISLSRIMNLWSIQMICSVLTELHD